MSKTHKTAIAFIVFILIAALIAWLGGYNFDERNPYVAFCAFFALSMAAILSGAYHSTLDK